MGQLTVLSLMGLAIATSTVGSCLMKGNATSRAEEGGGLVCSAYLILLCCTAYLLLLSRLRYTSVPWLTKQFTISSSIVWLIGSSSAWQLPPYQHIAETLDIGEQSEGKSELECSEDKCVAQLDVDGSLMFRQGHSMKFSMIDKKSGDSVAGSIRVETSETIIQISPWVILPHYDLVHGVYLDKQNPKEYKALGLIMANNNDARKYLRTAHAKPVTINKTDETNLMPTWEEIKQFSSLSEKFKCGEWQARNINIKQILSVVPRDNTGYIQWALSQDSVLNLTLCLEVGNKLCLNTITTTGQEIVFESGYYKIILKDTMRARQTPAVYLMSSYSGNRTTGLTLGDWRVMRESLKGITKWGTMGAVQTGCIWSSGSKCPVATDDGDRLFRWDLGENYLCSEEKPQQGIITTIVIGLVAAGVVSGAVVGGLAIAAGCRSCTVQSYTFDASSLDKLAAAWPSVDNYWGYTEPIMPSRADMTCAMDNDIDRCSVMPVKIKLVNYEDSGANIKLVGQDVSMVIDSSYKAISFLTIDKCSIDLNGGVSECYMTTISESDGSDQLVWTNDNDIAVITGKIALKKGRTTNVIGIMSTGRSGHYPRICVGPKAASRCATANKIDYRENPNPVGVIMDKTNDTIKSPGGIDFPAFWKALDTWWSKLIMIVFWVITIILVIVAIVIGYRLIYWAILIGRKEVNAALSESFRYRFKTHREDKELIVKAGFPTDLMEKDIIVESLKQATSSMIYRRQYCKSTDDIPLIEERSSIWPIYKEDAPIGLSSYVLSQPYCTESQQRKFQLKTDAGFLEMSYPGIKTPFIQPGMQICANGEMTMYGTEENEMRGRRPCGDAVVIIDGPCFRNVGSMCCNTQTAPTLRYYCPDIMTSDLHTDLTYGWETDIKKQAYCKGYPTDPSWNRTVEERDNLCGCKYKKRNHTTRCMGLSVERYSGSRATELMEKEFKNWYLMGVISDHYEGHILRFRSIYDGTNTYEFSYNHSETPEENTNTVLMPMLQYPLVQCASCPLLYIFYIDTTSGDSEEITIDYFKKIIPQHIHIGGDNVAMSVERDGNLFKLEITCDRCIVGGGGVPKLHFSRNAKLFRGHHTEVGRVLASRGGPMWMDCACVNNIYYCVNGKFAAKLERACHKSETYDNGKIATERIYVKMGSRAGIDMMEGIPMMSGTGMITINDETSMISRGEIPHSGLMKICDTEQCSDYYIGRSDQERDCSGFINHMKCLEYDHRTTFWLSVGLPLALLIFVIMLSILRCIMRMKFKERVKGAGDALVGMADRVVPNPAKEVRRRNMSSWSKV